MKRTTRALVAVLLTSGLAFAGLSSGVGSSFGFRSMTVHGASGCCLEFK